VNFSHIPNFEILGRDIGATATCQSKDAACKKKTHVKKNEEWC
jgi:hypothetical protein